MSKKEVKIAGFGGQGVILAGKVIGKAAALFTDKYATLTQSYGPEARGGACSVQIVISDGPIHYPYVTRPEVLILMSQEAGEKFAGDVAPGGILLLEEDLVKLPSPPEGVAVYRIPATRMAEDLGKTLVLNMVMVGFFTALGGVLPKEAVEKSIRTSAPRGTEDLNLAAFSAGYRHGMKLLE